MTWLHSIEKMTGSSLAERGDGNLWDMVPNGCTEKKRIGTRAKFLRSSCGNGIELFIVRRVCSHCILLSLDSRAERNKMSWHSSHSREHWLLLASIDEGKLGAKEGDEEIRVAALQKKWIKRYGASCYWTPLVFRRFDDVSVRSDSFQRLKLFYS